MHEPETVSAIYRGRKHFEDCHIVFDPVFRRTVSFSRDRRAECSVELYEQLVREYGQKVFEIDKQPEPETRSKKTAILFGNGIGNAVMATCLIDQTDDPTVFINRDDPRIEAIRSILPFPVVACDESPDVSEFTTVIRLWGCKLRCDRTDLIDHKPAAWYKTKDHEAASYRKLIPGAKHVRTRVRREEFSPFPKRKDGGRIVAFVNGSALDSQYIKKWPDDRWAELASALISDGHTVVFLGDEYEGETTGAAIEERGGINIAGQTTMAQAAYVLEHCDLAVTTDTALMHIADAVGTPITALWGNSLWTKCEPTNRNAIRIGSPQNDIRLLESQEVIEKVRERIAALPELKLEQGPPLVSVIVPTYNDARYLHRCLDSLRNQTYPNVELILVDDGSDDDTCEFSHKADFYVRIPHSGPQRARNVGLQFARGEYVITADSDSETNPEAIEKMVSVLEANPGAAFAYPTIKREGLRNEVFDPGEFLPKKLKRGNYINTFALVRRSCMPEWDEALPRLQDWDIWLTIAGKGWNGIHVDEVLYTQIIRKGGITDTGPKAYDLAKKLVLDRHVKGARDPQFRPVPRVSIVIPTIQTRYLADCFEALANEVADPTVEIIVVNDGGPVGEIEDAVADRAMIVHSVKNRGYAKSCNIGMSAARASIVVCLNDDTKAQPGWLEHLVSVFDDHPEVGISTALEISDEGQVLSKSFRMALGRVDVASGVSKTGPMTLVNGFCFAVRKAEWEALGKMDERYRNSCDDMDLAMRYLSAGFVNWLAAESRVVHLQLGTRRNGIGKSDFRISANLVSKRWPHFSVEPIEGAN